VRPRSIIWFERICLSMAAVAIAVTVVSVKLAMDRLDEPNPFYASPLLPVRILSLALWLLLWHAAARRGSGAARGFIAAFAAFGAFTFCVRLAWVPFEADLLSFLTVLVLVLQIVSSRLLFRPDADLWFAGIRSVDPEVFR
jgi:hypothetical protein